MARTGNRPRKRKFHGNQHMQRSPKSAKIEKPIDENVTIQSASIAKEKLRLAKKVNVITL